MGDRKKCLDCGKYDKFSKGLCQSCWKMKFGKPIRKISEKHQKTVNVHRIQKREFLKKRPYCEIRLQNCTRKATDIHHMAGKTSALQYLNEGDFLPACRSCHDYIELHPVFAKENGFSKNRL